MSPRHRQRRRLRNRRQRIQPDEQIKEQGPQGSVTSQSESQWSSNQGRNEPEGNVEGI